MITIAQFVDYILFGGVNILFISRVLSAIASVLTILLVYRLGWKLFNKKVGLLAAFVLTFSPGNIQHAHYNTTESLLILFLTTIIYFTHNQLKKFSIIKILIIATLCALAYGSKITGLTFLFFPGLIFINYIYKKKWRVLLVSGTVFTIVFLIISFLAAPYQIIDWNKFYSEQSYMQGVILGKSKPPFTIIYENSINYIYPLLQILPFIFGFISFPLALYGLFKMVKEHVRDNIRYPLVLLLVFPLLYFAWAGSWYAKYTRYYMLLSPFIALWCAYGLSRIHRKIKAILLLLIFLNGIFMMRIYTKTNTRLEASIWINQNIKSGSIIAGEHWDDNLPLPLPDYSNQYYNTTQLFVYDQDNNKKIDVLVDTLSKSDFFILSSRRVYQSIINNRKLYPYTSKFYDQLFDEKLGFTKTKEFTNYPFYFSDNIADESFQSYDHPPVLIYKNTSRLNKDVLKNIIINE